MRKTITFYPGWDRRSEDPKKDYGIHCVDIVFILKGKLGAVQFVVSSSWYPKETQARLDKSVEDHKAKTFYKPFPVDLGYHSPKPRYRGHKAMDHKCPYIKGGKCYYDGSGLNAHRIFDVLTEKGSEGVWIELKQYYIKIFGGLE